MSTKADGSAKDVTKQERRDRLLDLDRGRRLGVAPLEYHPRPLQDLPPSAKLVAKVLQVEGTMSLEEVAEESLLPDRTARYALNRLTDADVVLVRHDPYDARRRLYALAE